MTEDSSSPTPGQEPRDGSGAGRDEPRFSFSDKRRVDPTDGTVRPSDAPAPGTGEEPEDPIDTEAAKLFADAASGDGAEVVSERVVELEGQVADLEEELKRSQAEYVNSRRRIEASAVTSTEAAVGRVLTSLIGVLDDVELARQHGDLAEGTPFASITAKLEDALATHGMERFGAPGEVFDPTIHEALMHEDSADVETNTIKTVLQPGYRMKDRVLRPARVATYGPQ